jgi:hypothetical protein
MEMFLCVLGPKRKGGDGREEGRGGETVEMRDVVAIDESNLR